MKGYEKAIQDAEADVRAKRIDKSLPQRLLESDQIELYFGMPELFKDFDRYEDLVLNEIYLRLRNSAFAKKHGADKAANATRSIGSR